MSVTSELLKTPLHSWHVDHGGRMVDFAGWSMPVQYSSIIQEHQATRTGVGLFDVSHMGRFYFSQESAAEFLDGLTTRRVADMQAGRIRYSLMTNADGGILDDVLVYCLTGSNGRPFFFMVVNASNRLKILNWLEERGNLESFGFEDQTFSTAMIAVQGPAALDAVKPICERDPSQLDYYTGAMTTVLGRPAIVSRTGYTGEDGCELIVYNEQAVDVWTEVLAGCGPAGQAAGLGARDTLRLEAAMPLYGHELSEQINPVQADIGFAINLRNREFVGRDAILAAKRGPDLPRRVGLLMDGKRSARQHCPVYSGSRQVGEVTSGTFSPTLQKPIAMGYVQPAMADVGTRLSIDIRGKRHDCQVAALPFYKRQ